jgi:hypothetical protein
MHGFASIPTSWSIDRERDIYLVNYAMGGSQIDMPALYGFGYKGLGSVGLVVKHTFESDDPWCVIFQVQGVSADESIKPYLNDILPLIRETVVFSMKGFYPSAKSVKVCFPVF